MEQCVLSLNTSAKTEENRFTKYVVIFNELRNKCLAMLSLEIRYVKPSIKTPPKNHCVAGGSSPQCQLKGLRIRVIGVFSTSHPMPVSPCFGSKKITLICFLNSYFPNIQFGTNHFHRILLI